MRIRTIIAAWTLVALAGCGGQPGWFESWVPGAEPLQVPGVPRVTRIVYLPTATRVEWAPVPGAAGYRVYTNAAAGGSPAPAAASASNVALLQPFPADGAYQFSVSATNAAGEGARSAPLSAVVDRIKPAIVLDAGIEGALTRESYFRVTGRVVEQTAVSNDSVSAVANGVTRHLWVDPATLALDGNVEGLVEGTNQVDLSCRDIHGNSTNLRITIVRDSTPPLITGVTCVPATRTTNAVRVVVTASGATVTSQTSVCDANRTLEFRFLDAAGNVTTRYVTVDWIDTTGPDAPTLRTRNVAGRVELRWPAPVSADYARYELYRCVDAAPVAGSLAGMTLVDQGTTAVARDDTDVSAGHRYYYVLATYDDLGNRSVGPVGIAFHPWLDQRGWMYFGREDMAVAYAAGGIYMIGGYYGMFGSDNIWTVQRYDVAADTVTEVAHLLTLLHKAQAAVRGGRLYVFGGNWVTSQVESYDVAGNVWAWATPLPYAAADVVAASYGGVLYACAGTTGTGKYTNACLRYSVTNEPYGAYQFLAPKPSSTCAVGGAVVGDKWYVFSRSAGSTLVEVYDFPSGTWSTGTALAADRADYGCAAVGSTVFLVGGYDGAAATARIDAYDTVTGSWSRKSDLSWARYGVGAVAVDGKLYLVGGRNGSVRQSMIEVYDPAGDP